MELSIIQLVLVALFLMPPPQTSVPVVRYEASHEAMGTLFTVAAYGRDREYLAEVVAEVFEEVDRLDAQMSNYRPESEVSVINREAARQAIIVEPRLFQLLADSVRFAQEANGAFDPTVGPLMKHWGFFRGHGRLPSQAEIAQVLKRIGYGHLKLDPSAHTLRFNENGVELDLGGIAKGYAVDQAVEILRSNAVTAALISSGTSSLYALGAPPGERGWKIMVRDPYDAKKVADVVHLRNFSLSTSGSYEKFFTIGGKTYCHIMNPRTGWPVENMLSTTVMAPSTTQSDALSTSFFVLGVEGSRKYLVSHPNLEGFFYQPMEGLRGFKRTILRSNAFQLPPDSVADIDR